MIKPHTIIPCDRPSRNHRKVVAKTGQIGDWAAYEGLPNWTDSEVASDGDKLSVEEARALFPELKSMPYRR